MEHKKAKSPSKIVRSRRDPRLRQCILDTVQLCADVVGGTLGPHGRPVLIERQEWSLPPLVTKDGVTVFRSLGLRDPVAHCIMEVARDPSVRTAVGAGDGTTTATILMAAIVRGLDAWCEANPAESPQAIVRDMNRLFREVLEPDLRSVALPCGLDAHRDRTFAVARLSANGDSPLAKAVLQAFDICGDAGTVTIAEEQGPSGYRVEHVKGFPINTGFERDCGRMFPVFLNNAGSRVTLEQPVFLLHFGSILDAHAITPILAKYAGAVSDGYATQKNIVVVATGWAPSALDYLARNWTSTAIKIYPLLIPFDSPVHNAQRHFIDDLAAVTGAEVFDPATHPLETAVGFQGLGNVVEEILEDFEGGSRYVPGGVTMFQADRYTSSIFGFADEGRLLERQEIVSAQVALAVSEVDKVYIRNRAAALSGGIARVIVSGGSDADCKERVARVDDAVCAVRGALRAGAYPAGGWALLRLSEKLQDDMAATVTGPEMAARAIMSEALQQPFKVLLENSGVTNPNRFTELLGKLRPTLACDALEVESAQVWDAVGDRIVVADDAGLLDSAPAVADALRTAISTGGQLGTTAGCVVFPRDSKFEADEAHAAIDWERHVGTDVNDDH